MPMALVEIRLSKCHSPLKLSAVTVREVGLSVSVGKSTLAKLVSMRSVRSFARPEMAGKDGLACRDLVVHGSSLLVLHGEAVEARAVGQRPPQAAVFAAAGGLERKAHRHFVGPELIVQKCVLGVKVDAVGGKPEQAFALLLEGELCAHVRRVERKRNVDLGFVLNDLLAVTFGFLLDGHFLGQLGLLVLGEWRRLLSRWPPQRVDLVVQAAG